MSEETQWPGTNIKLSIKYIDVNCTQGRSLILNCFFSSYVFSTLCIPFQSLESNVSYLQKKIYCSEFKDTWKHLFPNPADNRIRGVEKKIIQQEFTTKSQPLVKLKDTADIGNLQRCKKWTREMARKWNYLPTKAQDIHRLGLHSYRNHRHRKHGECSGEGLPPCLPCFIFQNRVLSNKPYSTYRGM